MAHACKHANLPAAEQEVGWYAHKDNHHLARENPEREKGWEPTEPYFILYTQSTTSDNRWVK